jgi:hypothetical protein
MRGRWAQLAVVFLVWTAACARSGTSSDEAGPAPSAGLQVVIDNQNINALNIYLLSDGSRVLVGRADALRTSTLTIPESVTPSNGQITLLAVSPGAGRPIPSPTTVVPRGQRLYWSIGSDPSLSTTSTGD